MMTISHVVSRVKAAGQPELNRQTILAGAPFIWKLDPRKEFIHRYSIIEAALQQHRELGVLVFACDERSNATVHTWIKGSFDESRAVIIGRHSKCDLVVPEEHSEVSLRHLAVLVRAVDRKRVRIRVLDLNTTMGFRDEEQLMLQAVTLEGSAFFRFGRVLLMLLVTDESSPIPSDPEEAYARIPPRVTMDERYGIGVPRRSNPPVRPMFTTTRICSQLGPLIAAGQLIENGEAAAGNLEVTVGHHVVRRPVGASCLERGILIGRYARCDVGSTLDTESDLLSRVHFLITKDGDDVIGVDTASTNGTFKDGQAISLARIQPGDTFSCSRALDVVWREE